MLARLRRALNKVRRLRAAIGKANQRSSTNPIAVETPQREIATSAGQCEELERIAGTNVNSSTGIAFQ